MILGPQVNRFEQISSEDHQMSLVGGRVCLDGVGVGYVGSSTYHTINSMMHVMLRTSPPPLCVQNEGQTPVKTLSPRHYCPGKHPSLPIAPVRMSLWGICNLVMRLLEWTKLPPFRRVSVVHLFFNHDIKPPWDKIAV